jgi:hypothetical protein
MPQRQQAVEDLLLDLCLVAINREYGHDIVQEVLRTTPVQGCMERPVAIEIQGGKGAVLAAVMLENLPDFREHVYDAILFRNRQPPHSRVELRNNLVLHRSP